MDDATTNRLPIRQTALALIGELGSESNAHGVARIVRSRDSRRKVVWSLLVLLGVGAAISQLSNLVHKYLQYQVVEVSEIQDGLPVEFPSVTVCNIEPISWRKLRQLINHTTSEPTEPPPTFHNGYDPSYDDDDDIEGPTDVVDWLQFLETFHFGEQEAHMRSIRSFHENVGREALYVRHSLNESLLHCSFNKEPCSTANFTTIFDGNYYSCFTFNAQSHQDTDQPLIVHSTGPEHGLSVVMFLDNNEPPLGTYGVYTLDTSILHSAGARVMVHAPNTLPIPADHGQDVAPGFSTSVGIKPFLHARLSHPYGNCSDSRLRGLTSFDSTFSTCIAVCKQELIMRTCKCRSSALPHIPGKERVPYCGQVRRWRHMLRHTHKYNVTQHLPTLACEGRVMDQLKNDRGYEMDCQCSHPCGELSYHMSTSMSYWPTELYQFDALNKLYGATVEESPLVRAYKLHDQNIKEGEKLLEQIAAQGQAAAAASDGDGGGGGGGGSHKRRKRNSSNNNNSSSSSSRNSKNGDSAGNSVNGSVSSSNSTTSNTTTDSKSKQQDSSSSSSSSAPPPNPSLDYSRRQLDNLREASTEIRQNLLRLNVYLEDLSVVKFKQMPAYGMEDLFADIGGTLGLWMGVSVLTVMELLELIVRLSYLFFRAEWRPAGPGSGNENGDDGGGGGSGMSGRNGGKKSSIPGGGAFREMTERDARAREPSPYHQPDDRRRSDERGGGVGSDLEDDAYRLTDIRSTQGYSYRTEADYGRGPETDHHRYPRQELYDLNGHHAGATHPGSGSGSQQPRTEYNGRTKYWRLKRPNKSKR